MNKSAANPSQPAPVATYTARQIARALGVTRQAVAKSLPGEVVVAFASLPLDWQEQITRRAIKRGHANGEELLASIPVEPWKSPLPWNQVSSKEQQRAARLQKALARALALRSDPAAQPADVTGAALNDFKAEFGYAITERQCRRLLSRTVERDSGDENWQALEIYLDESAFASTAPASAAPPEFQHPGLDDVFSEIINRQNPTSEDKEYFWAGVLNYYEQQTVTMKDTKCRAFKASVLEYIFKAFPAGTLCKSFKSLKNRFNEKLELWLTHDRSPEVFQDNRAVKSGNFRRLSFEADENKIRNQAILLDGNESLAHRMLRERGQLSEEFCRAVPFNARTDKSNLPRSLRERITPQVDACLPLRRGPWQARMKGPYIPRDWTVEMPGDWFCADDVTWNHYYREQLPDGRWIVLRGECLMMIDARTDYPLEFLQISGPYNGEHVRSLMLRVHDIYGLPRKGFYFENGVWRSHLVTGGKRHGAPVHWREAESGFAKLNISIRHAYTPRAKPIEGVFGLLQERMRCIPGFVGFNERDYDAERVQPLIARAKRGDAAALAQLPTAREWADKIRAVISEFRNDPQNGKKLQGKSPAEAWREMRGVLQQFTPETRYILATHQRTVTAKAEGIRLKIRDQVHLYYNEHTGKAFAEGRPLLAYFNIENPELLVVSDMNRQNYFSVKRVELPAMSATPEQLQEVTRLRRAHMSAAKVIFGECEREHAATMSRDHAHTPAESELGRFHNEQQKTFKAESEKRGRGIRSARAKASAAGFDPDRLRMKNPDAVAEAAERVRSRVEALRREEEENAHE